MRRLLRRLGDERGIALAMALGIMVVLAISSTTAIYLATAGQKSATYSKGKQTALSLAEAGLNNTFAVLNLASNNALHQNILPACSGAPTTWNRSDLAGGYVRWCGTLDLQASAWNVSAIGYVRNPHGAAGGMITHKVSAYVVVTPTVTQPLNNPAWDYMYSTHTGSTCDQTLNNNVSGGARFYTIGNLCLSQNVNLSPSVLIVQGNVALDNGASVGAPTSMATRVETYVHGSCSYGTGGGSSANPCSGDQDVRKVYSKMNPPSYVAGVNNNATVLAAPSADFAGWYANSVPGPALNCSTVSGTPPTFDTNYPARDNNVVVQNLTPSSSYTCRVGSAGNPAGEISWDASTKVLTLRGTIYIDGSAKIDNGALNQYNGQAALYLSGTFYLNGKLCGISSGSNCDFNSWDPNSELLVVVANGNGGNGTNPGDSVFLSNGSQFEGAIFATNNITLGNNALTAGPMAASQIVLSNNVQTKTFALITVPVGMPSNPAVYAQPNPPQRFSG
jgi:Tfp pilus assembly protein PilX